MLLVDGGKQPNPSKDVLLDRLGKLDVDQQVRMEDAKNAELFIIARRRHEDWDVEYSTGEGPLMHAVSPGLSTTIDVLVKWQRGAELGAELNWIQRAQ